MVTTDQVAMRIDHTLLKCEATLEQVQQVIDEALHYQFASVCVNPVYVEVVREKLAGSQVKACTVVGFPLGANEVSVKAYEASQAVKRGAQEIDFVAHLPTLMKCDVQTAQSEFTAIVDAAKQIDSNVCVKVIIESAVLMQNVDNEMATRRITSACEAAHNAGCDFVKTSTGFHAAGGATIKAVTLMKQHAKTMQVKAAGGIRCWEDVVAMLNAGADRLGCSASVAICNSQS